MFTATLVVVASFTVLVGTVVDLEGYSFQHTYLQSPGLDDLQLG